MSKSAAEDSLTSPINNGSRWPLNLFQLLPVIIPIRQDPIPFASELAAP